ncbi:unnamed protein product [Boreogadus saida]
MQQLKIAWPVVTDTSAVHSAARLAPQQAWEAGCAVHTGLDPGEVWGLTCTRERSDPQTWTLGGLKNLRDAVPLRTRFPLAQNVRNPDPRQNVRNPVPLRTRGTRFPLAQNVRNPDPRQNVRNPDPRQNVRNLVPRQNLRNLVPRQNLRNLVPRQNLRNLVLRGSEAGPPGSPVPGQSLSAVLC